MSQLMKLQDLERIQPFNDKWYKLSISNLSVTSKNEHVTKRHALNGSQKFHDFSSNHLKFGMQ